MTRRHSFLMAFGTVVLGLLFTASLNGATGSLHTTHLSFSGPVALPGVTLPGGTYIFERAVATNRDVVVVRSLDRTRVYFMRSTLPINRPVGLEATRVTFGEARRGAAPPLAAWYPGGEDVGHAFIY